MVMVNEDRWAPVALSNAVEPSTSAGAVVGGAELVVWRDSKCAAHVWEDRCPHRGMRLSFGFVRGDHIACLYHGWEYDTGGQCQYIPAHPDLEVPQTIKARTYATEERDGLIWTRLEDGADPAEIVATGPATPVKTVYVAVDMEAAAAALGSARFGGESVTVTDVGPDCFRVEAGGLSLVIAGQRIRPGHVALHILIAGEAEPAERIKVARWAEGLRLALEDGKLASAMVEFA
jgi:phenylpropionate dioxygenase-like ring-hydroxylating dioxygenase large terminal subunit